MGAHHHTCAGKCAIEHEYENVVVLVCECGGMFMGGGVCNCELDAKFGFQDKKKLYLCEKF